MEMIMKHIHKTYTPEEAEEKALFLTENDDCDWTYKAKHAPTPEGRSIIQVFDEDGEYIINY